MNEITNLVMTETSVQKSTPESNIRNMIDYIQSFFDKTQPDITVPLIVVSILIIGFIFGWFRGFFRNLIVLPSIIIGLGIGIFVAPYILESLVVYIMERTGLEVEKHKPALELGIKLMLPISALIGSFSAYSFAGTILGLIKIFRKKKKTKGSLRRRFVMGMANGTIGTVAFLPGAILVSNLTNISRDSDNNFTNKLLNPSVKLITFDKGIGLGKNINDLKELFAQSTLIYNFFKDPKSVSAEERKIILEKTINTLNNPDLAPTIVSTITRFIKDEVDSADLGEDKKTITNDTIKTALKTNIDAVEINKTPITEYVNELNIVDRLNDTGKKSFRQVVDESINIYSEEGTDEQLKKDLSNKVYNELILKPTNN